MDDDAIDFEQQLIAQPIIARLNSGADPDVLAEALNTMALEISDEEEVAETVH